MLSKCANPECTASFRYLHIGKLFRMEVPAASANASNGEGMKKPAHRTEFFWLCETCAARMTLMYKKEVGVTTRPLPALRARAGL